jgi:hypothetical protein
MENGDTGISITVTVHLIVFPHLPNDPAAGESNVN